MVSYWCNGRNFFHKFYMATNFDSYYIFKNKYFENINQFEFNEQSHFRDFLYNSEIFNNKQFHDFCFALIQKTIKVGIELGGLYKNLWDPQRKQPVPEIMAQPLLFYSLRFLSEIKGINISRETVSANGSLDFFFHCTREEKSLKVCVELKNAHHEKSDRGNNTQLIEYIKDTGYKHGIYLVLWYKGENFAKPEKYPTIEELQNKLDQNPTGEYQIKNLIIDCSMDKISPSKL